MRREIRWISKDGVGQWVDMDDITINDLIQMNVALEDIEVEDWQIEYRDIEDE